MTRIAQQPTKDSCSVGGGSGNVKGKASGIKRDQQGGGGCSVDKLEKVHRRKLKGVDYVIRIEVSW